VSNGNVVIQKFNPATNSMDVTTVNTKSATENAAQMKANLEMAGLDPSTAESMSLQAIKNDPVLSKNPLAQNQAYLNLAVRNTISNHGGRNTWGKVYDDYVKEAQKEIDAENPQAKVIMKPGDYQKEIEERVSAKILANPTIMNNMKLWISKAATYSRTAGLLAGHGSVSSPDAAPKSPKPVMPPVVEY